MIIKNPFLRITGDGPTGRAVLASLLLAGVVQAQGNDPRVGVKDRRTKYMKPLMVSTNL